MYLSTRDFQLVKNWGFGIKLDNLQWKKVIPIIWNDLFNIFSL